MTGSADQCFTDSGSEVNKEISLWGARENELSKITYVKIQTLKLNKSAFGVLSQLPLNTFVLCVAGVCHGVHVSFNKYLLETLTEYKR